MARDYVFLLHGMGEHDENDWYEPFIDTIVAEAQRYKPYKGKDRAQIERDHLVFVPLSYDHVFRGYRESWKNLMQNVEAELTPVSGELADAFAAYSDSCEKTSGWQSFFWTHLLDPLLWYTLKEARAKVIDDVAEQILDGWMKWNADPKRGRLHMLAYSLGTSVAHDVLVALHHLPKYRDRIGPGGITWETVTMIANVSRLLQARFSTDAELSAEAFDVYKSAMLPGPRGPICEEYISVHHVLDPFMLVRPFDASAGGWPDGRNTDIKVTRVRVLQQVNDEVIRVRGITQVHDFDHYFADPEVHFCLLGYITEGGNPGTSAQLRDAKADYREKFRVCAQEELDHIQGLLGTGPDSDRSPAELARCLYLSFKELTT